MVTRPKKIYAMREPDNMSNKSMFTLIMTNQIVKNNKYSWYLVTSTSGERYTPKVNFIIPFSKK